MSFDKVEYRKRRKAGKRGQGEKVRERSLYTFPTPRGMQRESSKPVSKTAIRKNTKRARKAVLKTEDVSY